MLVKVLKTFAPVLIIYAAMLACAGLDKPQPCDAAAIECMVTGGVWTSGPNCGTCEYPVIIVPDPCEECTLAQECIDDKCVDPEPVPVPTPEPVCDFPQGVPDREFTKLPVSSEHADAVNEVMAEITGCSVGSRCVTGKSPQEFMQLVVAALRERGLCAGQHVTGHTDEIAVTTECIGGRWEGYHNVFHGTPSTVVWSPGSRRPAYFIPSDYCTGDSDPPPPTQFDCPNPVPDRTKLKLGLNKHNGRRKTWDVTPQVSKVCYYCADIGMGMYKGKIRCECPVRPEGNVDRSACERFVLGGLPRWFCDGAEIESETHPFQGRCPGRVKVCNVDLSVCSERSW